MDNHLIDNLGKFICDYREKHGLSLRAFAEKADISPTYVSNIEKGLNNDGKPLTVTTDTLSKISAAVGLTDRELIDIVYYDWDPVYVYKSHKEKPTEEEVGELSEEERKLLELFRMLSPERRKTVLSLVTDIVTALQ